MSSQWKSSSQAGSYAILRGQETKLLTASVILSKVLKVPTENAMGHSGWLQLPRKDVKQNQSDCQTLGYLEKTGKDFPGLRLNLKDLESGLSENGMAPGLGKENGCPQLSRNLSEYVMKMGTREVCLLNNWMERLSPFKGAS